MNLKKFLLALLMTGSMFRSDGQVLIALVFGDKLNTPQLAFGVTLGTSLTNISNLENADFRHSFSAGFYFDILLAEHFYLHPEVRVKSTLGARGLNPYPTSDPELDDLLADANVDRRINYFNVPVMAKYRNEQGWGAQLGPEISLRHRARDDFKTDVGEKEDLLLKVDTRDRYTRFDVGITGGISKKLGKGVAGVTVQANYTQGLIDIDKVADGAQKNYGFFINAAIPIGAGKAQVREEEGSGED